MGWDAVKGKIICLSFPSKFDDDFLAIQRCYWRLDTCSGISAQNGASALVWSRRVSHFGGWSRLAAKTFFQTKNRPIPHRKREKSKSKECEWTNWNFQNYFKKILSCPRRVSVAKFGQANSLARGPGPLKYLYWLLLKQLSLLLTSIYYIFKGNGLWGGIALTE
jgi:hypothetical protein